MASQTSRSRKFELMSKKSRSNNLGKILLMQTGNLCKIFIYEQVEMLLAIPRVSLTAKYSLNWQLALLNLQGAGDSSADIRDVKIVLKLTGSRYQRNGSSYIKFDQCKVEARHNGISTHFENLFKGQKNLEDAANQVINQNINLLERDLLPQIERAFERKILLAMNRVFERGTELEFFPN